MRTSQSTYSVSLAGLSLAKVDAALAALPATGHIDQINWPTDYPAAPETTFTLAHTDEMLFVRFEVKGEVPRRVAAEGLLARGKKVGVLAKASIEASVLGGLNLVDTQYGDVGR